MMKKSRGRARQTATAVLAVAIVALASGCGAQARQVGSPPTSEGAAPTTQPPSTAPPTTTGCPSNLAASLASTGGSRQLITVEAASFGTTVATVAMWQRDGPCWEAAGGPWTAAIGSNGFSDHHREGDDTTPTGIYSVGPTMYGNSPNPGVRYAYHQLVCGDWWDEDPTSAEYNTFQHVPCGQAPPFGGASEPLWIETTAYPSLAFVDYNTDPVVPYAGSAIFVHADIGTPTAGCVTIPLTDLDQLLRWLDPADSPVIVMGPTAEITHF